MRTMTDAVGVQDLFSSAGEQQAHWHPRINDYSPNHCKTLLTNVINKHVTPRNAVELSASCASDAEKFAIVILSALWNDCFYQCCSQYGTNRTVACPYFQRPLFHLVSMQASWYNGRQTTYSYISSILTAPVFLPRDATQSAVMPQYVVCLSVFLSVSLWRSVQVPGSHSNIFSRLISLRFMLGLTPTWAIWSNGNPTPPQN